MSNKVTGVEESAASVLKRAVALDNEQRYSDALICYQEGMGLLLQASKCKNHFSFFFFLPKRVKLSCTCDSKSGRRVLYYFYFTAVSDTKKQHYIKSVSQYMERAEKLKELVKHEESLKSSLFYS